MPIVRSHEKVATFAFIDICLIPLPPVAGSFPAPPGPQAHAPAPPARGGIAPRAAPLPDMSGIEREITKRKARPNEIKLCLIIST